MCLGIGGADVGAPCTGGIDCLGDFCIPDWPGGYCTDLGCDLGDPVASCAAFGGDGICVDAGGTPACFDQCSGDPDCRMGYFCLMIGMGTGVCIPEAVCGNGTVEMGEECEPPGTPTCDDMCQGLGGAPIGDPCTSAADCAGDACIPEPDWPMGYCTDIGCDPMDPVASCAPFGGDGYCYPTMDAPLCFDACVADGDCRAGYQCFSPAPGAQSVCAPLPTMPVCGDGVIDPPEECEPPGTPTCDAMCQGLGMAPVGDPCTTAGDCAGSLCITDADGFPGGYCTDICDSTDPMACAAAGGGLCLSTGPGGPELCFDECMTTPDCRMGYTCTNIGMGNEICLP
jgi:hypothetical protein